MKKRMFSSMVLNLQRNFSIHHGEPFCPGGPYTNVPAHYWDYVRDWINSRF